MLPAETAAEANMLALLTTAATAVASVEVVVVAAARLHPSA